MVKSQRTFLVGVLVLMCAVGAVSAPRASAERAAAPGPWCGGTLWKLMTLSDAGRASVKWPVVGTSIADVAKLPAPAKVPATRTTSFQKQQWKLTAVVDQYRMQSNGEIALVLFDTATSTYMNAYLPNPLCLSKSTRGRSAIVAARTVLGRCPAPQGGWQPLGATVQVEGIGFWNPLHTTKGALPTGAELRPVTGLTILSGCGT
jgi:hypothetical protein